MKATDVIRRDHEAAKEMFAQYKAASKEARLALLDDIFDALDNHESMESTYFYPAVREAKGGVFEGLEEEQSELKKTVMELRTKEEIAEDDVYSMMEKVLAHAKEEEQTVLREADETFDTETLNSLGDEMESESAVAQAKVTSEEPFTL